MSRTDAPSPSTRRLLAALWILAGVIALGGIILAITTGSWLPLVTIVFGLALPMMPLRSPATMRHAAR